MPSFDRVASTEVVGPRSSLYKRYSVSSRAEKDVVLVARSASC